MPEIDAKPQKKPMVIAYDYHECRDYLQKRDGYNERDYAGKWQADTVGNVPYQDFWHWVITQADIHNGCFFAMCEWWGERAEPWQREILHKYLDTFGEGDPGKRYVEFWVEW